MPHVFLSGNQRSGKTLVQLILASHPDVTISPGTKVIGKLLYAMPRKEPLSADAVRDVRATMQKDRKFKAWRVDHAAFLEGFDRYVGKTPDVMGWHDAREIPNYWAYAQNFVLQDHMFESDASWSLPMHLYMVSGWSAKCTTARDPSSCVAAVQAPGSPPGEPQNTTGAVPHYAWTDLTYLLHRAGVSWGYYVADGSEPDCADNKMLCKSVPQNAKTPGIWNPLPWFDTVKLDGQLGNIRSTGAFLKAARDGKLPSVSWVTPSEDVSEHPPALVTAGHHASGDGNANSTRRGKAVKSR